jgi:glycosyltransferase involved in cell wall biosynthesis
VSHAPQAPAGLGPAVDLTVIVPVYNEEPNLRALYARLEPTLAAISARYEILFVDDGSRDRSMEIVRALGAENPRVKYVVLSRNFGHQVALSAGLDHARGSAVAIIDADLQDPPELLAEMHAKLRGGFQVVYAQRRSRKDKSLVKKVAYKVFYRLLARLSQIEIPLDTGDFRIMDRKVVDALRAMPEQHKFLRGQVAWVGFDHAAVEYDRDARHAGAPGYTWRKLFLLAVDGITSFSDVPLRLATFAGLIVSFVAFLLIVYALVSYFYNARTPQGWTSLMVSVLFLGGIQLLSIGIIGEYIGRLASDARRRPLYFVKDTNSTPSA